MKCPKCGYHRQSRDNAFVPATECPACGVVYSKHENSSPYEQVRGAGTTAPELRPSPVDETSLKTARDRVEKRLRKQLQTTVQDDRHARTLKLARQITDEEIRKRRNQKEEWQRQDAIAEKTNQSTEQVKVTIPKAAAAESLKEPHPMVSAVDQTDNPDPTPGKATSENPSSEPNMTAAKEAAATAAPEHRTPAEPESESVDADMNVEAVMLMSTPLESPGEKFVMGVDSTPLEMLPPAGDTSQDDTASVEMEQAPVAPPRLAASSMPAFNNVRSRGNGLVRMLTAVAWVLLGAGVIGAVLSWTTISDVEAGTRISIPDNLNNLPLGLLLGFAYLATGALGFAFFWVSSIISRQLKDIQRLLMLQPGAKAVAGQVGDLPDGIKFKGPPEA